MFGNFFLQRLDHVPRLVQRQRRLRQVGHLVRVRHHQRLNLFHRRNHLGHIRRLALRPLDLFMVAMPHQHQRIPLLGELDRLNMHLGHQRTGRVDHLQPALLRALPHRRRNPMRRVDHPRALPAPRPAR